MINRFEVRLCDPFNVAFFLSFIHYIDVKRISVSKLVCVRARNVRSNSRKRVSFY